MYARREVCKMVKLGINVSEKKSGGAEEAFDTIPLITPLDAAQLQLPPPDTVSNSLFHGPALETTQVWEMMLA